MLHRKGFRATTIGLALLAAILVGVLLVPGTDPPAKATTPRALQILTVSPGGFAPHDSNFRFQNEGWRIYMGSEMGSFGISLFFPYPVVTIRKVTLYAVDNGPSEVCVWLHRRSPEEWATGVEMAEVCSEGESENLREFTTNVPAPRRVLMRHGTDLGLWIPTWPGYAFHGVRIVYGH